jgi:hypothetical protein
MHNQYDLYLPKGGTNHEEVAMVQSCPRWKDQYKRVCPVKVADAPLALIHFLRQAAVYPAAKLKSDIKRNIYCNWGLLLNPAHSLKAKKATYFVDFISNLLKGKTFKTTIKKMSRN